MSLQTFYAADASAHVEVDAGLVEAADVVVECGPHTRHFYFVRLPISRYFFHHITIPLEE